MSANIKRVDIKDVEQRLSESFRVNPLFNENNIGKDNTVEDKIVSFVLKLEEVINFNLDNFYRKLETLKLEPLSIYSNSGVVSYDAIENTGKISLVALKNDEENKTNVDNIFAQIMLMTSTSQDNYYGFGSVRELDALNKACTYMIASNLVGSAEKSDNEEEITFLNLFDTTLTGTNAKMDFVTAYFSNNGTLLKEELNKVGITDDILNEINYLKEAKLNGLNIPDKFASISNKINRNFALLVSNRAINTLDPVHKYKSHLFNDKVLDYSTLGVDKVTNGMIQALDYVEKKNNNIVNINDINKTNVMQKAA